MQQDREGFSLEQAVDVLRRRLPLVVLCVTIAAAVSYGLAKREPKKYTATASLAFSSNPLSQEVAGLPSISSSNLLTQQASNDLELVKLGGMAANTAKQLGHDLTPEAVASSVSVEARGESSVVVVSATAHSPILAAEIANSYTRDFVSEQQSASHRYIKSALAAVDKQLAGLSRKQRNGADGLQLENRAQTLSLLDELNYNTVQISEEAVVPRSPSSPNPSKYAVLGMALGLLLGLALSFVLERLDRRVRRTEDLEAIYRVPLLGTVPKSTKLARSERGPLARSEQGSLARSKQGPLSRSKQAPLSSREAEAFRLIRAQLRLINAGRELGSVALTSAGHGEGTTTVAYHLANAAARLGSRVLLLEGDLRHPQLAQRLGIPGALGLVDVLSGPSSSSEAIQHVELEPAAMKSSERVLDVLVAGAATPDPAELLESHAMDIVLDELKSIYDLVVVDTPPLTMASDVFSLLTKVNGVIIVARMGRIRRPDAEKLQSMLSIINTPVLGAVANTTKLSGQSKRHGGAQQAMPIRSESPAEWFSAAKS